MAAEAVVVLRRWQGIHLLRHHLVAANSVTCPSIWPPKEAPVHDYIMSTFFTKCVSYGLTIGRCQLLSLLVAKALIIMHIVRLTARLVTSTLPPTWGWGA